MWTDRGDLIEEVAIALRSAALLSNRSLDEADAERRAGLVIHARYNDCRSTNLLIRPRPVGKGRLGEFHVSKPSGRQNAAATHERLVAALRAAGSGTWRWDVTEDRVEWDEALAAIYGVELEQAPKRASEFLNFVHPDDRKKVSDVIRRSLDEDVDPDYEFRTILPNGSERWIYDRSKLVRSPTGQPLYMIGACLDITERKRVEEALRDSQTRLDLATNAAELGVWDWDLRTNAMVYSDQAKAICGFPLDQPVTFEQVRAATHPDDLPSTSAMAKRALDGLLRERVPYEYRIVTSGGAVRWVLAHGIALFESIDGVEKAVRYVGTIQDITSRRQAAKALGDSESRLRLAIDAGRMAVWEYDVATEAITGSPELNRLLGFPEDASPSLQELRAGYYPGEQERVRAAGADALSRGEKFFEVEYRYVLPDQSLKWLLLRAEIVMGPTGAPERAVGVLLDITEKRQAMDRQQVLINELNHRVKNTLAIVQSIASQTLRSAADLPQAKHNIETRLMALSGAHDLLTAQSWERAQISAMVKKALLPFENDQSRIKASGPDIWLDPKTALDLALALHELLTNAAKYGALSIPQGNLSIHWRVACQKEETLHLDWIEADGPPVCQPKVIGFGSRLIKGMAAECGGEAVFDFNPHGLRCHLLFKIQRRDHMSVAYWAK